MPEKNNLMGDLVKSVKRAQSAVDARPHRKAAAKQENFKTAIVFYHDDVEAVKRIKNTLENKGAAMVNFSTAVKTALRSVEIDAEKLYAAYQQVLSSDTRRSKTGSGI